VSTTIVSELRFEAAHRLPHTPEGHKCRRLHGHSFRCEVHVTGRVDPTTGWFLDFADVREAFRPLHVLLDHNFLNEVPGLDNPTSENIASWIWERLSPKLAGLSTIVVHETCTSRCIYTGPEAPRKS
jgi:6-pyruvoyltetrahydropterin/6-carboxytetrahydropterin synthase